MQTLWLLEKVLLQLLLLTDDSVTSHRSSTRSQFAAESGKKKFFSSFKCISNTVNIYSCTLNTLKYSISSELYCVHDSCIVITKLLKHVCLFQVSVLYITCIRPHLAMHAPVIGAMGPERLNADGRAAAQHFKSDLVQFNSECFLI